MKKLFAGIIICGAASGCDVETERAQTGSTGQAERIDQANDPDNFALQMQRNISALPESGVAAQKPFPSNWWPMREGGIAREWLPGSESPALKYDRLTAPDKIRSVEFHLAEKDWQDKPTNEGAEPETHLAGPATEWEMKNHGRHGETDPESWWGHCNGWASYVLNEAEPRRPVSVQIQGDAVVECDEGQAECVRFELADINALGAELYWSDTARMLGRRCEVEEADFDLDGSGRVKDLSCRDGNPGAFHIVTTNMIGRLERPYIVDLNADRQVWNYPVYRYELTENREIDVAEALRLVEAPEGTARWTYNSNAKRFMKVRLKAWIVEDAIPPSTEPAGELLEQYTTIEHYDYILELDADGEILGGEWTGRSKSKHPDFLWYSMAATSSPRGDDRDDSDNPYIRYSLFKQILTLSQDEPGAAESELSARPNVAIPDNDATGISSTIEAGDGFSSSGVRVRVQISHSYRGDLSVALHHAGQEIVLHQRSGGGADDLSIDKTVEDFQGVDAAGQWTLKVVDHAGQDVGRLVAWSLGLKKANPAQGETGYESTRRVSIPDNNAEGARSVLSVPDHFTVRGVSIKVAIKHTYRGDLTVGLEHEGRRAVLVDQSGGSDDDIEAEFDSAVFDGLEAAGAWTLTVVDHAGQDVGHIEGWSLDFGDSAPEHRRAASEPAAAIPDNSPGGIVDTIDVEDAGRVGALNVTLDIDHSYVGDLVVRLTHGGKTVTLHDRSGEGADNIQETFETDAFNGLAWEGPWVLEVSDHAAQDVGTLKSWQLEAQTR